MDRDQYKRNMQEEIRRTEGLTVLEDSVDDLVFEYREGDSTPKAAGVCLGNQVN